MNGIGKLIILGFFSFSSVVSAQYTDLPLPPSESESNGSMVINNVVPGVYHLQHYMTWDMWGNPGILEHGVYCIGGSRCGTVSRKIILKVAGVITLSNIVVYAHDDVGSHHGADLKLYIDGQLKGRADVLKVGSLIHFPAYNSYSSVDRARSSYIVQNEIKFESVQKDNKSGGDETVVQTIYLEN